MRISILITLLLQSWLAYVYAQKFRNDYMWAKGFSTFYRLHDAATTWENARSICDAEGTSLLVPHSIDEVENLKLLLSNMKAQYTAIFIGLHDQYSQGNFVDIKGVPIVNTLLDLLWSEGSPDNVNGTEDCVIMTREGLLDDVPCNDFYPFLCKILAADIVHNEECNNYDVGYIPQKNGKCYKFHEEPLPWHDAYRLCRAEQGHLTIINSQEEASLVTSFLGEHLNSNTPDPNILFIGFSDLMYPFQYRTIYGQSLEEAGYSSWDPIKGDPAIMSQQRCGAITRTGFLRITWCNIPAMFLCEVFIARNESMLD